MRGDPPIKEIVFFRKGGGLTPEKGSDFRREAVSGGARGLPLGYGNVLIRWVLSNVWGFIFRENRSPIGWGNPSMRGCTLWKARECG